MCSGFKVLVDCRHVQHHILPIRPFSSHHFINVLAEKKEAWLVPCHLLACPNSLLATAIRLLWLERGLEGLFWSKPDQKHQRPDQETCSTLPSAPGSTSSLGVSVASEPPALALKYHTRVTLLPPKAGRASSTPETSSSTCLSS